MEPRVYKLDDPEADKAGREAMAELRAETRYVDDDGNEAWPEPQSDEDAKAENDEDEAEDVEYTDEEKASIV
jgi:hypothetical protein